MLLSIVKQKRNDQINVNWTNEAEMKASNNNFVQKIPNGNLMKSSFAVADGRRLPLPDYTDAYMQNAFHEGYTGNVEVPNLLVFNFFGDVIHAVLNFPGSWYGYENKLASMSGLLFPKLDDSMTPPGYAILRYSAVRQWVLLVIESP